MNVKIICPDCKSEIITDQAVEVGDILECRNCATEVEVLDLNPIRVEIIEEEK